MDNKPVVTVIGVGNPIMSDDGLGLELLARLQPHPQVALIDGGTSGMEILPDVMDAQHLLLLDAMKGPGRPGDLVSLSSDQIPRLLQSQLSPHQVGLLDLLSAARLIGREPAHVHAIGVVAANVGLGIGLSACVEEKLALAAAEAERVIKEWLAGYEKSSISM